MQGYNGYENYPTWRVLSWIDEDEYIYDEVEYLIKQYKEGDIPNRFALAESLKELVDQDITSNEAAADLLEHAIDQVNFDELVEELLDD